MTCQQIVDAILRSSPPTGATNDVFHAGDPNVPVGGVAVVFQATINAINEAKRRKANFIITHEPTFYDPATVPLPQDDPVVSSKLAAIGSTVIWRCHDYMHRVKPDLILAGVIDALGWAEFERPSTPVVYDLPPTTLGDLCNVLKDKLSIDGVRTTADLRFQVKTVAISCGCAGWERHRSLLKMPDVDVLICGEAREWETYEYARDARYTATPKAVIVLGHAASEEAGMRHFAGVLAKQFDDIPVHFIPVSNAFRCV